MSTWHQDLALTRSPNPLAHATMWRVVDDPPGKMMTVESFTKREDAYENMAKAPHRYVVAPQCAFA